MRVIHELCALHDALLTQQLPIVLPNAKGGYFRLIKWVSCTIGFISSVWDDLWHFGQHCRLDLGKAIPSCSVFLVLILTFVMFAQGATLQITLFDPEKKLVVCTADTGNTIFGESKSSLMHISGRNVLSNAQVNLASILITSVAGAAIGTCCF